MLQCWLGTRLSCGNWALGKTPLPQQGSNNPLGGRHKRSNNNNNGEIMTQVQVRRRRRKTTGCVWCFLRWYAQVPSTTSSTGHLTWNRLCLRSFEDNFKIKLKNLKYLLLFIAKIGFFVLRKVLKLREHHNYGNHHRQTQSVAEVSRKCRGTSRVNFPPKTAKNVIPETSRTCKKCPAARRGLLRAYIFSDVAEVSRRCRGTSRDVAEVSRRCRGTSREAAPSIKHLLLTPGF